MVVNSMRIATVGLITTLVIAAGLAAPAAAHPTRGTWRPYVVTQCNVGQSCWNDRFVEVQAGQYCSSSVGCFTAGGRNWRIRSGVLNAGAWTQDQANCVASIIVAGLSFRGGATALGIAGGVLTMWSCKLSF